MRLVRALRHPLAPVALVAVLLPAATLLAPADQRIGWLVLDLAIGGPLAAVAAVFAFRRALARIAVPPSAPASSPRERKLETALRSLLVLVAVLGPMAVYLAALGARDPGVRKHQTAFLCLVPLLFIVLGWQLWRDLVSARRRRAQGLEPLPFEGPAWTGDARLDSLVGRKPRWTARLVWMVGFVSALGFLSPGHALLAQLAGVKSVMSEEAWRFATASVVHGDLVALAVSAMVFLAIAPTVEMLLGSGWLLIGFFGGGIAATAASYVYVPTDFMGSTGAAAALTGLLLFVAVQHRRQLPPATAERIALHGLTAVVILAFAGALLPNADTAAHLGGFTFGALAGIFARPSAAVRSAMERARRESMAAVA